jgi:hypothetical protein
MGVEINLHAFVPTPALHEIPGRLQTVVVVKGAFDQRRQGWHEIRGLAVDGADLKIALDSGFRKQRRQMIVPVLDRRALAVIAGSSKTGGK